MKSNFNRLMITSKTAVIFIEFSNGKIGKGKEKERGERGNRETLLVVLGVARRKVCFHTLLSSTFRSIRAAYYHISLPLPSTGAL